MTLKMLKTIQSLPKNNYNISKSMRENGYAKSTSRSGEQYRRIRRHTKQLGICDPERIKKDINYVYKLAKKKEDITNINRNIELRSKIAGMVTDKSEVNNLNPDKIIIAYGDKSKPVAKPITETTDTKQDTEINKLT